MNLREYPRLGERAFWETLPNGLTVVVVPKPGFSRKMAYFVTDFGSIHTEFVLEGQHHRVPAGIAHYLEHKMFDMPGRDVSAELAKLGANVNAFTSYDMTAYYFSCTENFSQCLARLLEFVATPYFTEESVEKERGIIDQEIGMNEDAPDSRVFEAMLEGMYRHHNIRTPILGTGESIREITAQLLHTCHRAFYTPGNMILCVVGDVEPEAVCTLAREYLGDRPMPVAEKCPTEPETMTCPIPSREARMEVSMPSFQLGMKCRSLGNGDGAIRREVVGDLAAELLFGEASELYLRLYEQGLIDSSFGGGFETVEGCAMLTCGGDSHDPAAVMEAILAQAQVLCRDGIDQAEFLRMKRSSLGRRIRDLDSFDSTCFRLCAYHFSGFDYFEFPRIYQAITVGEVLDFIGEVVHRERCCLSVIRPVDKEVS